MRLLQDRWIGRRLLAGSEQRAPSSGYEDCGGGGDVPWLSEDPTTATLAPGESITVAVTLDASAVDQPGTYTADLIISDDTPFESLVVPVTMNVNVPGDFTLLEGTVTGAAECGADAGPLAGATVFVDGQLEDFELTDRRGRPLLRLPRSRPTARSR